jgi:DNA-binding NarL/FixJ family response regulator
VKLLLAHETRLVREGIAAICERTLNCQIVGHCSDGPEALETIRANHPDFAFLDWSLPRLFALEIARQVREANLPTKVAVLGARADRRTVQDAVRAGVSAYLLKSGPAEQIREAVDCVRQGGIYISPLLDGADISTGNKPASEPLDPFETLSPREFQVFSMLVDGVRAKEIAARLRLSPKTVDTYRASLMQKLEIYDLAGLVKFAIQRSFTTER